MYFLISYFAILPEYGKAYTTAPWKGTVADWYLKNCLKKHVNTVLIAAVEITEEDYESICNAERQKA